MIDIDTMILTTFEYEENTIYQVGIFLKSNGINESRNEIKSRLCNLLKQGLVQLYDDPSDGKIHFRDSDFEFEEDYWFVLTDEGKRLLNN